MPAANVHWVEGPTWQYLDNNAWHNLGNNAETNPDWGQWGGGSGNNWLSWLSPKDAGAFSIRAIRKITCGDGGDGEPIDIEADWSGKVKNEINIILPTEEDEYTAIAIHDTISFDCDRDDATSYTWNWDDPEDTTDVTTKEANHVYTKAGTYTATLKAKIEGKDVSDTITVYVIGGDVKYSSKDTPSEKSLMGFCGQDCSSGTATDNWHFVEQIDAADGQPEGTEYEWQVTPNLKIIEGQGTAHIKVIGVSGSPVTQGQIQANGFISLHYEKSGKGITATEFDWKVHSPRLGSRVHYSTSVHGNGYDSVIAYPIIDQVNTPIDNVYIEEKFDVWHSTTQYPNENWPPADEKPGPNNYMPIPNPQNPGQFINTPIYMEIASAFDVENSNFTPSPQNPASPYGTDKVQYARQKLYIGCAPSPTGVLGCLVADHYLVYYRDHADHEAL